MDIQWTVDVLAPFVVAAGVVTAFGAGIWFLIGRRIAPIRKDLACLGAKLGTASGDVADLGENVRSLKSEVSDLKAEVSGLGHDMNANFSKLNGKFDTLLILLGAHIESENQPTVGSSQGTADSSGQSEKSE